MWESLLLSVALAASPSCTALDGWNSGRSGSAAAATCDSEDYREAHRLGSALKQLRDERAQIEKDLPALEPEPQAAARRRQRQLDIDLEAIHGLATIKALPLDPAKEPTP
jgi:hypothetical protein